MSETPWSDYEEEPVIEAGKRCGLQWTPWMGDFFTSWSPRNSNNLAEGPWDHWVDLALHILAHPFTQIVRPDAYRDTPKPLDLYDATARRLTSDELLAQFPQREEQLRRQDERLRKYQEETDV